MSDHNSTPSAGRPKNSPTYRKVKIEELNDETLANERLKFETRWNFFNYIRTSIAIFASVIMLILLTIR